MKEPPAMEMALSIVVCAVAEARRTLPSYEAMLLAAKTLEETKREDVAEIFEILSDGFRRQGY